MKSERATLLKERSSAENRARGAVAMAVAGYATCSSLMLILNKIAVHTLPAPSLVLFVQLMLAAAVVRGAGMAGLADVDKLEYEKVRGFAPVALAFLCVIYANIKTLQHANVETFIVFRASTPLVVSLADYFFLGRALPSCRSWLSLIGLVCGVCGYVLSDTNKEFNGCEFYECVHCVVSLLQQMLIMNSSSEPLVALDMWIAAWYTMFCFDQIYIKHAVETVNMRSNWGRVFYCNFLAALPLIPSAYGEFVRLDADVWTANSAAALMVSSLLGCGISYFAFLCRKVLSATAFTVVGNCCKIATITINCIIWDLHASPEGIGFLLISLACAFFYRQAPLRNSMSSNDISSSSGGSSDGTILPVTNKTIKSDPPFNSKE